MKNAMRAFARARAAQLRKRLGKQIRHAAKHTDEDAIHDLRVAMRRLSQWLKEFQQFLPAGETKKTRKHLKKLMHLTSQARDRDIAIELLGGVSHDLTARLKHERKRACRALSRTLARRKDHGLG